MLINPGKSNIIFRGGPFDGKFMVVKNKVDTVRFPQFGSCDVVYHRTNDVEDYKIVFETR